MVCLELRNCEHHNHSAFVFALTHHVTVDGERLERIDGHQDLTNVGLSVSRKTSQTHAR